MRVSHNDVFVYATRDDVREGLDKIKDPAARFKKIEERTKALGMYKQLVTVADTVRDGTQSCAEATAAASQALRDGGFDIVEYFTVVDADSLKPLERVSGPARVIAAARLGRTRLIDNLAV